MAKDSSFDVVSTVDLQEVDNAYQQTARELTQRYDLKQSHATIDFDKQAKTLTIVAPSDFVAKQVQDVFGGRLVKRGIDLKAVNWGKPESASGGNLRIRGAIVMGIDKDLARKISKDIRDLKLKCKVQIEDDKLRVQSASKDTLQQVIAFLREKDYGIPIQYVNYR